MFGYTVPMYSRLSPTGLTSYRRYYCETCHQLKREFGIVSTLSVNYDMTFNTIVMNAFMNGDDDIDATPSSMFCVLKRPGTDSELFRKMAAYTILLTKWELVDDSLDKPSVKSKLASVAFGKAIAKAEEMYPEYDEAVGKGFDELRRMESAECSDPIIMGSTFGKALSIPLSDIIGSSDADMEGLFTNLTAAVYIMDAIDDLEEDYMDGTFNPFLVGNERLVNKEEFINDHVYELTDVLNRSIGDLQYHYSSVRKKMHFDIDLTDNIVYYGIPQSAKSVMSCSCHSRPTIKNMCDSRLQRNATY